LIDKLRFVLNTHEQVCHPRQLSLLVQGCTSGEEEKSISQLVSCLRDIIGINPRACEFLVNLALRMEIIEKNLHWASRGWVISRLPTNKMHLTPEEKVAYLKYYLDADGALIINFLKELVQSGEEGLQMSQFLREGGVERVFIRTAEEYMAEVFEISPRYELSKLLSLNEKSYSDKVRTDKFLPHIEPLVDLGFVDRVRVGNSVRYLPHLGSENGLIVNYASRLLSQFSSALSLDEVFSKTGDFFKKASVSFGLAVQKIDTSKDYTILKHKIIGAYDEARDNYFRMARLGSIYDLVCIRMLFAPYHKLCEELEISQTIQRMNELSEDKIRFHVDDMGIRQYVTISEEYVKNEMGET
jgi:hypothetical protein